MSGIKNTIINFFNLKFRAELPSKASEKCQEIVTLNDMPIPNGDFFKLYKQRQRRHNSFLVLGVIMFASAVMVFRQSKIVNLNFSPPETLEDEVWLKWQERFPSNEAKSKFLLFLERQMFANEIFKRHLIKHQFGC